MMPGVSLRQEKNRPGCRANCISNHSSLSNLSSSGLSHVHQALLVRTIASTTKTFPNNLNVVKGVRVEMSPEFAERFASQKCAQII